MTNEWTIPEVAPQVLDGNCDLCKRRPWAVLSNNFAVPDDPYRVCWPCRANVLTIIKLGCGMIGDLWRPFCRARYRGEDVTEGRDTYIAAVLSEIVLRGHLSEEDAEQLGMAYVFAGGQLDKERAERPVIEL